MAIKKNGSRNSDRVKIRRMNLEGFSLQQIAAKLSIVEEHVTYVLEKWTEEEENWKTREQTRVAAEMAERHKFANQPLNAPPPIDVAALTASIRAEIMAELRAGMVVPPAQEEKPVTKKRRAVKKEEQVELPLNEEDAA